jgi:hypothetical protein
MTATLDSSFPAADAFGHRLAAAGDPLSGQSFDAIYESRIKPELVKAEGQRRGAVLIFIAGLGLAAALVALEVWLTGVITEGRSNFPNSWVLILTVFLIPFFAYIPLAGVGEKAKRAVITALCDPIGISYALGAKELDGYGSFLSLNLLPRNSRTTFEDIFTGERAGTKFTLCNATLVQGSGKNQHTVFQGQVFHLSTPRRLLGTTVVLRNSGWLNMFEKPKGLDAVGLEDPVFNKAFVVFGSDQVEARELLTPVFMQELNDLEAAYKAAHLRCGFQVSEAFIAMQGKERFRIGSLFSSLVDRSRVENIARDIEQVFKLIDRFDG